MKKLLSLLLIIAMLTSFAPMVFAEDMSENVTLSIMASTGSQTADMESMPVFQKLQEDTNTTLVFNQVRSDYDEKLAVMLASNDLPDIFLGGLTDAIISGNQEAFADLTDLIDQYAPNIKKMFEEDPATLAVAISPDGGIYSLPAVRPYRPDSGVVMMINQTWLDNLGLEMPTTLEELENVLIAFRDNDPNQNGLKDELPLDWPENIDSWFDISALCGSWGVVGDQSAVQTVVKDGVVSFLWEDEAYYNLMVTLGRWYSEDLIYKEFITDSYSDMQAMSKQGEYAVVGMTLGWSIADRTGKFSDQYVCLEPLKATADSDIERRYPSNRPLVVYNMNRAAISSTCEDKVRAIQVLDLLYAEWYSIQMYYGSIPNQVIYDEAADTYEILAPTDMTLDDSKWVNSLVDNSPLYFSDALAAKTTAPAEETARIEQDNVFKPYFADEVYPLVKFSADVQEELTFIQTDIMKYANEKYASWIVNGGVENEWEEYIQKLTNMGLDEMRQIYQDGYDAARKN